MVKEDKFRSGWETRFARLLDEAGIPYLYEPVQMIVLPEFEFQGQLIQGIHYTPDFYLPSHDIFVEIKGYRREEDLLRYKLFLYELSRTGHSKAVILYSVKQIQFFVRALTENSAPPQDVLSFKSPRKQKRKKVKK